MAADGVTAVGATRPRTPATAVYPMSCPAVAASGPCCPQPVIRPKTSAGLRARQASGPTPSRSATPGRYPSISRSARATRSSTRPGPSGALRSTTTERLLRLAMSYSRLDAERRGLGAVHPDHVGAEVAQQHRGERSGSDPGEFDHPNTGQRPARATARTTARVTAVHTAVTHGRHGPSEDRRSLTVKL